MDNYQNRTWYSQLKCALLVEVGSAALVIPRVLEHRLWRKHGRSPAASNLPLSCRRKQGQEVGNALRILTTRDATSVRLRDRFNPYASTRLRVVLSNRQHKRRCHNISDLKAGIIVCTKGRKLILLSRVNYCSPSLQQDSYSAFDLHFLWSLLSTTSSS